MDISVRNLVIKQKLQNSLYWNGVMFIYSYEITCFIVLLQHGRTLLLAVVFILPSYLSIDYSEQENGN